MLFCSVSEGERLLFVLLILVKLLIYFLGDIRSIINLIGKTDPLHVLIILLVAFHRNWAGDIT
jgi:hypothetical protein